jgi:excisionase family DNA binding protein
MEKEFYTTKELAELFMVSPQWVKRKIKIGELPSYRIGRQVRFKVSEIQEWIEKQKQK